ncbi:HPr kinase/phosphorylase [Parasedimentitalea psychrophila]|uniref:HPr kinase/phosphatase C-terminal domain-containing protein n=1 Tax=Parasedimentitalea psychrophila TaxID=2997337 RepID=A0A9Y2P829_9RHOB|nr:HPr kinase/phosphatase C-terminal domain-containing protein [Parasedimentitalea psychrophila]WIY26460.1 HPr kinase/phosphatase C-terminal domain-containing protein [Parasedimentitalea psychrophila]
MGGIGDLCLHASCVSLAGNGLLIRGASGSGKSTLALSLMALGARLVADDRVLLSLEQGQLIARAPEPIGGLIEARGLGILQADQCSQTTICAVIDLDIPEVERLPPIRTVTLLGQVVTLLHRPDAAHLAPALLQYLKRGRQDPDAGTQ